MTDPILALAVLLALLVINRLVGSKVGSRKRLGPANSFYRP